MPSLWDYVQQYPGRLRDQFTQGMQQFARTRNPVAALGALNPTTPFIQDAALQAGGLIAPRVNQLSEAVSQSSENLGLGPLAIPKVLDKDLAPFLLLGMGSPSKMGFFSPSGKALTTAPSKGTSQQYLAHLRKEPGATKEAKQTGLIQRLEEAPGTLTKEEVVSMWNPIELTETVRQELPPGTEAKQQELKAKQEEFAANTAAMNRMSYEDRTNPGGPGEPIRARQQNLQIQINNLKHDLGLTPFSAVAPKWADKPDLNLPGGEEPKEILLQLPESDGVDFDSAQQDYEQYLSQLQEKYDLNPMQNPLNPTYRPYVSEGEFKELERLSQRRADVENREYKSSHWDEPNVLAHIRANKRDVGGVRALHAEEFQSDWHQEGQKKGYYTNRSSEYSVKENEEGFWDILDSDGQLVEVEETREAAEDAARQFGEGEITAVPSGGKVPDAPFKKDWHELAFKRFLMEGINDPSVDRLTWTSGAVQADRYNLAKQIDELFVAYGTPGAVRLSGIKDGGVVFSNSDVQLSQLDDYVGKEIADRIRKHIDDNPPSTAVADAEKRIAEINAATGGDVTGRGNLDQIREWSELNMLIGGAAPNSLTLSGVDLEVGGEFHKNLYDKKIPQFAKKFLKKYGVEPKRISDQESEMVFELTDDFETPDRTDEQVDLWMNDEFIHSFPNRKEAEKFLNEQENLWYIDITPEMRQDLQKKGVPLAMNNRRPQAGLLA